jgi:hypothetical protein
MRKTSIITRSLAHDQRIRLNLCRKHDNEESVYEPLGRVEHGRRMGICDICEMDDEIEREIAAEERYAASDPEWS